MFKIYQLFVMAFVTLLLSACGGSGGGNSGGGTNNTNNNLTTYTEAEAIADLENLNSTEKGLESYGLKLKSNSDYNNGLSTTTYYWDTNFLKTYFNSHPLATEKDMIPALENYVKVANAYSKKYSGPFKLKKNDGSVEAKQLAESTKKEIDTKVNFVNRSITKLKAI